MAEAPARQPLLPRKDQEAADDGEKKDAAAAGWRSETGKLAYLALPMVAVSLSQYAVQVSSNMMVGHLPGVLPLSSAAIATSLASVSGFSLLVRTPLETYPVLSDRVRICFFAVCGLPFLAPSFIFACRAFLDRLWSSSSIWPRSSFVFLACRDRSRPGKSPSDSPS